MTPEQLLRDNGIFPKSYAPGRYYTTCPHCSRERKKHNRNKRCLGITIGEDRVFWGCNHCGWTGPEKGSGNSRDTRTRYEYPGNQWKVRTGHGFSWEHEEADGTIHSGAGDTSGMLYRVEEAREHGDFVAVVEGEKDCDALWHLGIAAVTSPHGAAKPEQAPKWTKAHSEQLRGLDIVVLNDNDEAGYAHARAVVECSKGIAKSIRRLDLRYHWPNGTMPIGADISDWLAEVDEIPDSFERMFRNAPLINGDDRTSTEQDKTETKLPWVTPEHWFENPPDPPGWTVKDLIPRRRVTLFSGHGAAGKSTVALHLAAAHVINQPFLNFFPEPGPAFFIDAEDEAGIICQRLSHIADFYEVTLADFANLHILSLADKDALLATAKGGVIVPTDLFLAIEEHAKKVRPQQIVIASSANVFAGNEIDRSQVTQFIGLLNRLAAASDGSVILISHPSLTGIASDSGLSGSTGWHNAVRSQMYLKGTNGEDGEDSDLRKLEFKKNQYGKPAASLTLQWKNGMFLPPPVETSYEAAARESKASTAFLTLMRDYATRHQAVSHKLTARNYAPNLFIREDAAKGFTKADLTGAMNKLISEGRIAVREWGPPSRRFQYLEVV